MHEESLQKLLSRMLYIRMVEVAIAGEYPKGEIRCPTHLCIGEEAIAVGVSAHLRQEDIVFSTHRSHGHYLAKGGDLSAMIAELYGKATGCAKGIGGSQHLIDLSVNFWGSAPIVASTIPVAVGVAFSVAAKKENRIVVCFFGEAATEEGVFFESINFAALKKLPILFVCENNFYSTNTPLAERQAKRSNAEVVGAMGIGLARREDGNDVGKVTRTASEAVRYVRSGRGPAFVEFVTYRTLEHCGPFPDPAGFRPQSEKLSWQKKDPVKRLVGHLRKYKRIDERKLDVLKKSIESRISKAFTFAKKSPYPTALREDQVYAS